MELPIFAWNDEVNNAEYAVHACIKGAGYILSTEIDSNGVPRGDCRRRRLD